MRFGADVFCGLLALCFIAANCTWSLQFRATERQLRVLHTSSSQLRSLHASVVTPIIEDRSVHTSDVAPPSKGEPQSLALWLGGSGSSLSGCPDDCHPQVHADMWGQAVGAGGSRNLQDSPAACCAACRAHAAAAVGGRGKPCNVWVHCGDAVACGDNFKHCWLKHQPNPMEAPMVGGLGVSWGKLVPWTSGVTMEARAAREPAAAAEAASKSQQRGLTSRVEAKEASLAIVTSRGRIRLRLNRAASPNASSWLASVADSPSRCQGCRFYRCGRKGVVVLESEKLVTACASWWPP